MIHGVHDSDTHFIINPITRVAKNEGSKKTTLIQGDHNSERFTFEIPRYIEGHDMALCNRVEVHYLNVSTTKEQKSGVYTVDDLQISPDNEEKVIASWLISSNATHYAGALNFVMRFCCVEGNGIVYAWNTAICTDITISSGINAGEMLESEYVDAIEQWKETLKIEFGQWQDETAAEMNADIATWKETESAHVRGEMAAYSAAWNQALNVERKRIDNIVALEAGSTTGDAELQDIRTGADGVIYDSAGAAVRGQFNNALHGILNTFDYTINDSSTYAYNFNIDRGIKYKITVVYGDNVSAIDIGYTTTDGTDIQVIDNAVSGREYEITTEFAGTRFRLWTYLKEPTETTVNVTLSVCGLVERGADAEANISDIYNSLYGYKAKVTRDSLTVAAGHTLRAYYTITAGRKFYVSFDSFNYDVIERVNIYCNNAAGNEIFHDSIIPTIGAMYECCTDKENATLEIYMIPTAAGGAVDFDISIYEAGGIGNRLIVHDGEISGLANAHDKAQEDILGAYEAIGIPFFVEYRQTLSKTYGWDIEYSMQDGRQYVLSVADYTGAMLTEIQLYMLNSMQDYISIQSKVNIGDSVTFTGNSAYKYIRVYVVLSEVEIQPETLTIKIGEHSPAALVQRVDNLETAVYVQPKTPNLLILGDSYSQMGYWINQLKQIAHIGDVVNLGVSSASLKDKYTDRNAYPYNDRPVLNDPRGGNVNTFGSQILKLKRLMAGTDLDDGESAVYQNSTPDIILIEGGTNDPVDTTTDEYISQIYTVKKGYIKRRADTTANQGYIKIPTHYEDTKRTIFAGAMRYLYGVLHELFPQAYIFFITPCGLTYMSGGEHSYLLKGEQIKQAAAMLGIPVIDWGANGRLTLCDNAITGTGTQADPYIYDAAGKYSVDALHPNQAGAHFLAQEVAKMLHDYNLIEYRG